MEETRFEMTRDEMIKKLFNKRKPTGTDLGRFAILVGISNVLAEQKGEAQRIFDEKGLERRISTLGEEQFFVYYSFIGLFNILQFYKTEGQAYYQQALRSYYHLLVILNKPNALASLDFIADDFSSDVVGEEWDIFSKSIEIVTAIDQFYKDVEEVYKLPGLYEAYHVSGNLNECIDAYNRVMKFVKEEKASEYDEKVLNLPYVTESVYIPKTPVKAKNYISNIEVFKGEVCSASFYNVYRGFSV